jgi:putative transposase
VRLPGGSRSAYHAWPERGEGPTEAAWDEALLIDQIRDLHAASDGTSGKPCITAELARKGWTVNHKRVERPTRQGDLQDHRPRRGRSLTKPVEAAPPLPDLLGRAFQPELSDWPGAATPPTSPPQRVGCTWPRPSTWPGDGCWAGPSETDTTPAWSSTRSTPPLPPLPPKDPTSCTAPSSIATLGGLHLGGVLGRVCTTGSPSAGRTRRAWTMLSRRTSSPRSSRTRQPLPVRSRAQARQAIVAWIVLSTPGVGQHMEVCRLSTIGGD